MTTHSDIAPAEAPAALAPLSGELPAGPSPAAVYLASLADGPGRTAMRSTLGQVATMLGMPSAEECPWHELRHRHVAELRARLPAGRALDAGELSALFRACADGTPAGARDAAAFALMFGCGLRRAEAVSVAIGDYDAESGALRIVGKGNKERTVYAMNGGRTALGAWIALRGDAPGPLLAPVSQTGAIDVRPMTAQALMMRLKRRARQAEIASCSPHDLRRSFVSTALESGADLAMVQALAGHASPVTTARYDRRPEHAKAEAAKLVHVPFVAGVGQ